MLLRPFEAKVVTKEPRRVSDRKKVEGEEGGRRDEKEGRDEDRKEDEEE